MEKYVELLGNAKKRLMTADHMIYITFPLVREKRLLVKILDELSLSTLNIINAILYYEHISRRISFSADTRVNFNIFKDCAFRYNISYDDIKKITELILLTDRHKKSAVEFLRKDKLVVMSNNLHTDSIDIGKLKEFLMLTKSILNKAELRIYSEKPKME